MSSRARKSSIALALMLVFAFSEKAHAWGDEGHEVIGLIADHYLDPTVRDQVNALLATDPLSLTPGKDIASQATWADKYRDSDRANGPRYTTTNKWHFIDIEIDSPDIVTACKGHIPLPAGTPASLGPADSCVTDKISQFLAELKAPETAPDERREALEFLLHFVGDVHQPLHASDRRDKGGNDELIATHPLPGGNLHHYWDTEFVELVGIDANTVAQNLIAGISDAQRAAWAQGSPETWAQESFAISRDQVFGALPAPTSTHHYTLPQSYVDAAKPTVATQLQRAGIRLAWLLNDALGSIPLSTCSDQVRAAALPTFAPLDGSTFGPSALSTYAISASQSMAITSSLPFDSQNAQGLQAKLEARLLQAGWTKAEAVAGTRIYSSLWTVRLAGCGAMRGTLTIVSDGTPSFYHVRVELIRFN